MCLYGGWLYGGMTIYGREVVLSIDKSYNFYMKDCIMQIVEEVPYIRKEAWCMIWYS